MSEPFSRFSAVIDGGGDCAFNYFYLLLQQPASVKYDVNLKENSYGVLCLLCQSYSSISFFGVFFSFCIILITIFNEE